MGGGGVWEVWRGEEEASSEIATLHLTKWTERKVDLVTYEIEELICAHTHASLPLCMCFHL